MIRVDCPSCGTSEKDCAAKWDATGWACCQQCHEQGGESHEVPA
jgi:hypothetical protein